MKLNRNLGSVILISTLLLTACGGSDKRMTGSAFEEAVGTVDDFQANYSTNDYDYEASESASQMDGSLHSGLDDQMMLDRKLIKNASLSFQTDSLASRKAIVNRAVKTFNAYVEHEEQYNSSYEETVTTTIRVPAINFDPFMDAITAGVGSFDTKTIEVDDVTEEYVDVAARINTKKELKIRFIALLDKAETIAKIIEVEREINALQAEIESYEGRLKYLTGNVKYATVNLTYYRSIKTPELSDTRFESAFTNGWKGTVWFFVGLVSIWPLLLLIIIILLFVRFKIRKSKG